MYRGDGKQISVYADIPDIYHSQVFLDQLVRVKSSSRPYIIPYIDVVGPLGDSLALYYSFPSTSIHTKEYHCGSTWANLISPALPC